MTTGTKMIRIAPAAPVAGLTDVLDFTLPVELAATQPAEQRGLARDEVRLMVSYRTDDRLVHAHFRDLPQFLGAGDVLVINTSGTLNAALNVVDPQGKALELHLSTRQADGRWSVEARRLSDNGTQPYYGLMAGDVLTLPGGGQALIHALYAGQAAGTARLWLATLDLPQPLHGYLAQHGFPIRYGYVREPMGSAFYQTVYATELGSAEMPSAGRAFTPDLITRLVAQGVQIAPLILHTGVSSQESHEPPYAEYYRVPATTAQRINAARAAGGRIIAVGTTVIRALESVATPIGTVSAGEGWTDLVVTPERGIRAVDGLITGFHEPRATHLAMLEALCGRGHLQVTYAEALAQRYLWHEFGDLHLLLPADVQQGA
jgi:S-adenosylmethionine:tRNA ribosyltransferase-isomerase